MSNRKNILVINRKAPYGSSDAKDALDISLIAGAFDQKIQLLFIGDGIFQLLKNQDGTAIRDKTLSNTLEALELYEIKNIFAETNALSERNIENNHLIDGIQLLNTEQIKTLMSEQQVILNF